MHVYVKSANTWLDDHIRSCIKKHVPESIFVKEFEDFPNDAKTSFQFCDGWELTPHFTVLNRAENGLVNAYPNSDALARKDLLSRVVELWTAKRPNSILKNHMPLTVRLSLDYAEYVDDALMAAEDLTLLSSLEENEEKDDAEREWWILKPALIDCGSGIRIFSTIDELAGNLELAADLDEEWSSSDQQSSCGKTCSEAGMSVNGETVDGENGPDFSPTLSIPGLDSLDALVTATGKLSVKGSKKQKPPKQRIWEEYLIEEGARIPSAQMREFVAQRYITSLPLIEDRKWHVRAYVVLVGRLKVYVYREMLTLLALDDYEPPWKRPSLKSSLTNTALQEEEEFVSRESMRDFWKMPGDMLPGEEEDWKEEIFKQICDISAETVSAAAHTMADKFMPLNKCFELFALDFLVDTSGNCWLLEANETPAFYEHGFAGALAERLMESLICVAMEHMGMARVGDAENAEVRDKMVQVLDETNKLAKSNITEIMPES